MKTRLRKGSELCQAVSASGRAGDGWPQETAPSSSSCLWLSFQSPDSSAALPLQAPSWQRVCRAPGQETEPGRAMEMQEMEMEMQEMGEQKHPVLCS